MLTAILSVLALGSAIMNIRAEYRGPRYQVYLFKPLTTLLILLVALQEREPVSVRYRYAILAGLGCSLLGDVFLMLPGDRFVAGLASFLVAHLCYIVAFSFDAGLRVSPWLLAPCLLYAVILFRIVLPRVGNLRVPVLAYGLTIVAMVWRALERWAQMGGAAALVALVGAVLFVISDSALAINRFVGRFKSAHVVVLGTYFVAQWLIALSV